MRSALILGVVLGALAASAQLGVAAELADLEVHGLAVTDQGSVIYQVANRGKGGTERPFVVDVYVDGVRRDSITHGPLPGLTLQTAQSGLARLPGCKTGTVRLVLDPQNGVRERSKANNERVAQLASACAPSTR
jgi:hypothetical protein